jgi:Arc/MetJ-type ribon-helix-helix transcriptional regulator
MSKKQTSVTLNRELVDWVNEKIVKDKRFSSMSHAVNYALQKLMEEES